MAASLALASQAETGTVMARLPLAAPRMTTLRPTLAAPKDEAGRSRYRRDAKGHKLYSSRRWRGSDAKRGRDGLRWQVLLDAMFTCAMCGRIVSDPSMLVADHIVPHKGDPELFFDRGNLWAVDRECHDTTCQEIEARHDGQPEVIRAAKLRAASRRQ